MSFSASISYRCGHASPVSVRGSTSNYNLLQPYAHYVRVSLAACSLPACVPRVTHGSA